MQSPLLLICHRRPELTKNLFEAIANYKPNRVFVFCDGPSPDKNKEKVIETQKVIRSLASSKIYSLHLEEKNLGCGKGVKKALDWFFSENDYGIILEDDVMPSADFFLFVEKALEKHRDDPSVASVSGFCPWPNSIAPNVPFLRSKYFSMWGWGTWAKVWKSYVLHPHDELASQWSQAIRKACNSDNENEFWQNILHKIKTKEIDTWDYQFFFQAWAKNQVHIRPPKNLVKNLGFGSDATHTGVEPWFVKAQKTPLTADEPHWFLDAAYFYFRHLTYLDNGNFSLELASKRFHDLSEENKKLKRELQQNILWRPFHKILRRLLPKKNT